MNRTASRFVVGGALFAAAIAVGSFGSRVVRRAPSPVGGETAGRPAGIGGASIARAPSRETPAPADAVGSAAQPGFDVNAVIERVHYAFKPERGALRGGHTTYASSVTEDGAVSVRPVAYARAPERPEKKRGAPPASATPADATLAVRTTDVRRGSAPLSGGAPRVDVQDGAAVIHRGAVEEHVRNTKDGVEQSWGFAARPDGAGDVVVRVRADGLAFVGATSRGLHFAGAGGLGVRYGEATWVDARGARTAVRVERTADGIAMRVPANVVDASAYPAVLDPVIGPEQGIDDPVPGDALATYSPAIAAGDGVFLVGWEEYHAEGLTTDVRAARVRASDGALLDPVGIPIGVRPQDDEYGPAIAFANGVFLVAWMRGARASTTSSEVVVTRVNAGTGAVSDADGVVIAGAGSHEIEHDVALAASGSEALLAWIDGNHVAAQRVAIATGAALGAGPVSLPAQQSDGLIVDVAAAAGANGYLVTWVETPSGASTAALRGAAVSSADVVTALPAHLADTTYPLFDGLSYTAGKYVATYAASPLTSQPWQTAALAIDEATNAVGAPIVLDATAAWAGTSITCAGGRCAAFWGESKTGAMHMVGRSLNPATGDLGATTDYGAVASYWTPCAAQTTGTILTAFEGDNDNVPLRGRRIRASDLVALDAAPFVIGRGHDSEQAPALVASGTTYLVAWSDTRGDDGAVMAVRVDAKGALLDAAPLVVSTAGPSSPSALTAAAGDAEFLVAWGAAGGSLVARTIGVASGALSSPMTIAPAGTVNGWVLRAAAHGATALVTWDGPGSAPLLSASLVDLAHATAKGPTTLIAIPSGAVYAFVPVTNGSGFDLVGYTWVYNGGTSPKTPLQVWSVDGATAALGAPTTLAQTDYSYEPIVATAASDRALVAWSCSAAICALRYDPKTHAPLDSTPITIASPTTIPYDDTTAPAVANDGARAYLLWQPGNFHGAFDVVGVRVRLSDGAVVDGAPFSVAASAGDEVTPSVACIGPESCLAAYGKFDDSPAVLSQRLKVRTIGAAAIGGACGVTDDCASGTCVDGVCCATACGGGAPDDCMACNVAGHEGTCAAVPASAAIVCRPSTGTCDVAESCDGASTACPPDLFTAPGTACEDDLLPCTSDACDGHGACAHPAGNAGLACRPAAGVCDVAESCDGVATACPPDAFKSGDACRAPSCASGVATLGASCSGSSPDCPPEVTQVCAPYVCGATGCAGSCAGDADCVAGDQCVAGVCTPRFPPGHSCTSADQCDSGFCVDGVCCTTACAGGSSDCQACDSPGSVGTCTVLPAGFRCAGDSCVGRIYTPEATCDGLSTTCPSATPRACDPFTCVDGRCAVSCTSDAQCAPGFTCVGGVCLPPGDDAGPGAGPSRTGDDGGAPASGDAPPASATSSNGGCACDVVAPRSDAPGAAFGLAIAAMLVLRRRGRGHVTG